MIRIERWVLGFAAALVALQAAGGCYAAGDKSNKLNIGDAAPEWSGLVGTNDQKAHPGRRQGRQAGGAGFHLQSLPGGQRL